MNVLPPTPSFWRDRLVASTVHLGVSITIGLVAALLVFGIWYPYPYREISGGRDLFLLVVSVDVILGPLVTLAVFNRAKPWKELRRDLFTVALIQLGALGFGLWTVFVARPVHLVFEFDRYRVVHAIEVDETLLPQTPAGIQALPLTGPTLLAVRPFKDDQEKFNATMAALQGVSLASRPDLWQSYDQAISDVLKAGKRVKELEERFPAQTADIKRVLADAGRTADGVLYLPLAGRKSFWTVFIDPITAQVITSMPLDSF
jgi:hypothetical protein